MKKVQKFLLCAVAVLVFSTTVNAQTNWVSTKVGNKVSVKFPKAPESVQEGIYQLTDNDSSKYTATFVDLEAMGLDSATLSGLVETEEFADQFKTGLVSQVPGLEINKSEITKWNGLVAYVYEGVNAEKKQKATFKTIFMGAKMFTFICIYPEAAGSGNKDLFINSLELIK